MSALGVEERIDGNLELTYVIIYSFWYFYDKVFFPQTIHIYTHKLVRNKLIDDYWRDWIWTGVGPYSPKLGYEIMELKNKGFLKETCVDDGTLCGLLTISENAPHPDRLYLITI